jgi:isocitrate dehydrogenase
MIRDENVGSLGLAPWGDVRGTAVPFEARSGTGPSCAGELRRLGHRTLEVSHAPHI